MKMVLSVSFIFLFLILSQTAWASTISGFVYDKQRNPLNDVDVELLDEYYRQRPNGRMRTDSTGRYQFTELPDGYYTVRVMPFRYDLLDQSQLVEIVTMTVRGQGIGNAQITADFYLLPKKGGLRDTELSVIFVQEIPKEAEAAYKLAVEDFSKKRETEGFANLRKSLELFPTYYNAWHKYGMELYLRKQYMESAQAFMEAVKINEKSAVSFYYIGGAFNNLGKPYNKAALRSLNMAYTLAPASMQVLWLLGKVEREMSMLPEAEKHLLAAKKLAANKVPEIHWELSQLYSNDLKKYKEAADELELYLKASKASDALEKEIKEAITRLREKAKTVN